MKIKRNFLNKISNFNAKNNRLGNRKKIENKLSIASLSITIKEIDLKS